MDAHGGLESASAAPDEVVAFAEHLERLLATLEKEERLLLDLRLQDRSQGEIAETLGVSERTVRRLLRRLESRLREALGPG
jgi:RNA polymerase sigma factor (sigma-70 family)